MEENLNLEKHKAKARLLKELSEKGIGGEKTNAETKLKEHLKKHNLTIEDIDSSVNNRRFKVSNEDDRMIFTNVILSVNPFTKLIHLPNVIDVSLDEEDFNEVKNKLRYFIKLWREEKEILTMAFFSKHKDYFQPDEWTKNKWREKKKLNEDLEKATLKADKIDKKLSKSEIEEMNKSLSKQHEKLQRMTIMSQTLKDAEYARKHKTINI